MPAATVSAASIVSVASADAVESRWITGTGRPLAPYRGPIISGAGFSHE